MPKAKGATPKKSPSSVSFFAAMLVGMLLTMAIGLFIYLWNPFNQGKADLTTEDMPTVRPVNTQGVASEPSDYEFYDLLKEQQVSGVPDQALASQPLPTNPTPDVVVHGKPNQSEGATSANASATAPTDTDVEASVSDTATATDDSQNVKPTNADNRVKISDSDTGKAFILQINSFDNADEADRRRAEVLMAGVDAQIVKKRINDGQLVYQVISNTMPNSQMAAAAQRRLQSSGIDSLIVEQRRQ